VQRRIACAKVQQLVAAPALRLEGSFKARGVAGDNVLQCVVSRERRQTSGERRQMRGERRQMSGERRQMSGERRQMSGEW
jgi:hypothetical protein